jgi:hypothetical protein
MLRFLGSSIVLAACLGFAMLPGTVDSADAVRIVGGQPCCDGVTIQNCNTNPACWKQWSDCKDPDTGAKDCVPEANDCTGICVAPGVIFPHECHVQVLCWD